MLLGRRAIEPFKNQWDIPGGFLLPWEHPEEAVVREVLEETGLIVRPTQLLGIFMDTYGTADFYTLNLYYLVDIDGGALRPADDVAALQWFAPDTLPFVAFAHAREVLRRWSDLALGR